MADGTYDLTMPLFRRASAKNAPAETAPAPVRTVRAEAMIAAGRAVRKIEQRVALARADEVLQAINTVRDYHSKASFEECRAALETGLAAVKAGAQYEELDNIARVIASGELDKPIRNRSAETADALTPSESAQINEIIARAAVRSRQYMIPKQD